MSKVERNYEFRERINQVHFANRRDAAVKASANEVEVTAAWKIVYPADGDARVVNAAKDLQEYLEVSMDLALTVGTTAAAGQKVIKLELDKTLEGVRTYRLDVTGDAITVAGADEKGIIAGCIYIEDLMNLKEAPVLAIGSEVRKPLIGLRMVHSGWGIDLFPSEHLKAMAHAGFTCAVVFITGIDRTNVGTLDVNDVIDRAWLYGLDVMLYAYLPSYKHPAEPDAAAFFEGVYTKLFNYYPKALGVMLVGESAEFPSRDPRTTGRRKRERIVDGIPTTKPSPGWWPCSDYPDWLKCVCDAAHKAKPDAMVIFNTYNWYWASEDVRREFLERVPKEVTIQITFDIGKELVRENLLCQVRDYSISADEPSDYFKSECKIAHELGLSILSTANTAGLTWDFGTVPYVPVPQQWIRRFEVLEKARQDWNVDSYYDNHHYGWWPSVVTDLGKFAFWSPRMDLLDMLKKLAVRDFGAEAADAVLKVWDLWSDAMKNDYVASNEEQYGPMRVGPSYPLIFHPNITRTMGGKEIKFPTTEGAHFGWHIIKTMYQPYESARQAPGFLRFPVELRALERLHEKFARGVAELEKLRNVVPERKLEKLEEQIRLGKYITCNCATAKCIKEWYMLNIKLLGCTDKAEANSILDKLEAMAKAEIKNAESAIPLVDADSRLGWEPSMEYVTDRWHIEWKIRQVNYMLGEIKEFRDLVNLQI